MNNIILSAEGISAKYEKLVILENVDFSIEDGRRVLLIGPNGAGKSTFLKVVAGLKSMSSGKIIYLGKNIEEQDSVFRVRSGIVYLKQNMDIFNGLKVRENLELAGYFLKNSELKKRIDEIFVFFPSIKTEMDTRAGLLSGGQRRLLGISMVLLKKPKLILLDEPTAGLSPVFAKQALQSIFDYLGSIKSTILIVEHNLSIILNFVDEVTIMMNGQIVKKGLEAEIVSSNPKELDKYYFEGNGK